MAFCTGVSIAYFMIGNFSSLSDLKIDSSSTIYLTIPFAAYFLSNFLFKSQLKKIDPKLPLEEKFPAYQTASIIRWAILEGAAFILLFMFNDYSIFGTIIIVYLILVRPTENSIKRDLDKPHL